ncbi:hypothetical protein KKI24_28805 [bacterium]|nr:hypothetical protein [bacterium]
MEKWIKNRKNQVSIILVLTALLVISNIIVPAYDSLSYYHLKIASLEKQSRQLHRYALHINYHENLSRHISEQLAKQQQLYANMRDAVIIQKWFGKVQRQCRLTVVMQQIKNGNISGDLERIDIRQTLEGKYSDHVRYLNTILSQQNSILLERYKLQNQSPLMLNPILTADLQLFLFLPLK